MMLEDAEIMLSGTMRDAAAATGFFFPAPDFPPGLGPFRAPDHCRDTLLSRRSTSSENAHFACLGIQSDGPLPVDIGKGTAL